MDPKQRAELQKKHVRMPASLWSIFTLDWACIGFLDLLQNRESNSEDSCSLYIMVSEQERELFTQEDVEHCGEMIARGNPSKSISSSSRWAHWECQRLRCPIFPRESGYQGRPAGDQAPQGCPEPWPERKYFGAAGLAKPHPNIRSSNQTY